MVVKMLTFIIFLSIIILRMNILLLNNHIIECKIFKKKLHLGVKKYIYNYYGLIIYILFNQKL